jgi:hypothetical protein
MPDSKLPTPKRKTPLPRKPAAKQFSIQPWVGNKEGEKIILYGKYKLGKSTLAMLLPNPAFIGTDDGGRKLCHPVTGEPPNYVQGITGFGDVRDALQSNIFDDSETIVIDTATELQHWALPYMFKTIKAERKQTVTNIEGYGYGKGYRHLFDTMRFILADCDRHIRAGRNVAILCQNSVIQQTNVSGENYAVEGPDLYQSDKVPIRGTYLAWADHVLKLGYAGMEAKDGKVNAVKQRAIYVHSDATFEAGSRTIPAEYDVVEFNEPSDDSIWRLLFGGE